MNRTNDTVFMIHCFSVFSYVLLVLSDSVHFPMLFRLPAFELFLFFSFLENWSDAVGDISNVFVGPTSTIFFFRRFNFTSRCYIEGGIFISVVLFSYCIFWYYKNESHATTLFDLGIIIILIEHTPRYHCLIAEGNKNI